MLLPWTMLLLKWFVFGFNLRLYICISTDTISRMFNINFKCVGWYTHELRYTRFYRIREARRSIHQNSYFISLIELFLCLFSYYISLFIAATNIIIALSLVNYGLLDLKDTLKSNRYIFFYTLYSIGQKYTHK